MTMQTPTTDHKVPERTSGPLSIEFDPVEFMHFLSDTDWDEDSKVEYITLVWSIVCEFVAMGFDVHPLQQAQKTCGEPSDNDADSPVLDSAMVKSSHSHLIEKFVRQSGMDTVSGGEGVIDG